MKIIQSKKDTAKEFREIQTGSVFQWLECSEQENIFIKGESKYGEFGINFYAVNLETGKVINLSSGAVCMPVDAEVVIK